MRGDAGGISGNGKQRMQAQVPGLEARREGARGAGPRDSEGQGPKGQGAAGGRGGCKPTADEEAHAWEGKRKGLCAAASLSLLERPSGRALCVRFVLRARSRHQCRRDRLREPHRALRGGGKHGKEAAPGVRDEHCIMEYTAAYM